MSDPPTAVLRQFRLDGPTKRLSGGSEPTYRVGDVVLKRVGETSLENNHSPTLVQWIAAFTPHLGGEGYRLPQPIATVGGRWITDDGWTAWTFLEGRHSTADDVPACIAGIQALHRALRGVPRHPLMDDNRTPWGYAHRWCWGQRPPGVWPQLAPLIDRLYELRRPIAPAPCQVTHGDLNAENILIAPGLAPGFVDLAPFWAPPEFALAIYANWIGPRRGDVAVLRAFADIPDFDQLLVRAAIRMLLVMSVTNRLDDWETCEEKRAAELVIAYAERR